MRKSTARNVKCICERGKKGGGVQQTYGGGNAAGVTARWDEIKAERTSK